MLKDHGGKSIITLIAPTDSMISNFFNKFKVTGSVENSSRVHVESPRKRNEAKDLG